MKLVEIKNKIIQCLEKLYQEDSLLFERNNGKGLCERCIVFRFAMYLQEAFNDYFVDCDFNSSLVYGQNVNQKAITNPNGTSTGRYIDIIVHKRLTAPNPDFICFEVKKWNNRNSKAAQKDINNLRILTREYGYRYGFYLILGQDKEKTKWTIFKGGNIFNKEQKF